MILDALLTPYTAVVLVLLYYLVPWLKRWHYLDIPAPFPASFSNLWLLYQCRRGRRYQAVHDAHQKYGKLVRIQPNHISIADDSAIQAVYGHGNGFLKTYAVFVLIPPPPPYTCILCLYLDLRLIQILIPKQGILRRLRLHPPRPLQHARPRRAHAQAQDRRAHLQRQVGRPVRAVHPRQPRAVPLPVEPHRRHPGQPAHRLRLHRRPALVQLPGL